MENMSGSCSSDQPNLLRSNVSSLSQQDKLIPGAILTFILKACHSDVARKYKLKTLILSSCLLIIFIDSVNAIS